MSWNQDGFKKALDFAAHAHGEQRMKGSGLPYVVHVVKVATEVMAVADGTFDVDFALQCALLHDCMEDCGVTVDHLAAHFGPRVAEGVAALTKDPAVRREARMADALQRIAQQPREVQMVKLGDRITNLEPPPPEWTVEKRREYLAEAQTIYDALHGAHAGLARRLRHKMEAYRGYTAE